MNHLKPLILAQKISKIYKMNFGEIFPLKEASVEIFPGDSVSIMGPSGSGKSTLLHILGCLDRPSSGNLFYKGKNIKSLSDVELSLLRAKEIGFVFQAFNLLSHLNVYENIILPFQYQESLSLYSEEKVLKVVDQVKLSHRLYHLPSELSGGELQRAAIARALVISPALILADEPTGNLDSTSSNSIISLLKEVNIMGVTVVVITHDDKVASQFHRNLKMQDGALLVSPCN